MQPSLVESRYESQIEIALVDLGLNSRIVLLQAVAATETKKKRNKRTIMERAGVPISLRS